MKTRSMVPCRYIFPFVVAIPLFNYYYELFVSYLLWVSDFCIAKKCMRAVARSNSWIDTKMDISYSYTNLAPPRTTCHLLIITIIESLLIVVGNNQRMEFSLAQLCNKIQRKRNRTRLSIEGVRTGLCVCTSPARQLLTYLSNFT